MGVSEHRISWKKIHSAHFVAPKQTTNGAMCLIYENSGEKERKWVPGCRLFKIYHFMMVLLIVVVMQIQALIYYVYEFYKDANELWNQHDVCRDIETEEDKNSLRSFHSKSKDYRQVQAITVCAQFDRLAFTSRKSTCANWSWQLRSIRRLKPSENKKKEAEADDTLAQSLRDRGRSNECDLDGSDW